MKMKELESRTGVSRESIRYYIREGLLPQPKKLKRNVAEYGIEHVERTQLIKRLQDEHFLPLKVVKDVLDTVTDEASRGTLSRPALSQLLSALIQSSEDPSPVPVGDLIASTCLSEEEIEEMADVNAINIDAEGLLSAQDAEIVRLWADARSAGFTAERGWGLDFLKRYVDICEQWAELETGRFLAAFADTPDEEAAQIGARGLAISNRLAELLHNHAVLRLIRESSELVVTEQERARAARAAR